MPESQDQRPDDPVEAVRPSRAGRRKGRLIPVAIFIVVLLIFAYIILTATLNR